jgi:N-acetylglucosamine kinase-like BadF-type ATPase
MNVLGIDGGGTKTTGVIADQDGNVLSKHTVGATNPNSGDHNIVEKELTDLFNVLKNENVEAFSKIEFIFIGMSGVDRPDTKQTMAAMIERIIGLDIPFLIDNDAVNALYSGTLGEPGIVNIAGTGSITFGINDKGKRDRVGGWGYLLNDTGSGYEIGRQALVQIFNEFDENGKKTLLTELFLDHFDASSPPEFITNIYEPGNAKKVIPPLCELVFKAADEGDETAKRVLLNTAEETGRNIKTLVNKLFAKDQYSNKIPIILTGGVYKREDWFVPTLEKNLTNQEEIIVPRVQPVAGALVAGFKNIGVDVSISFIDRLIETGLQQ